MANKEWGLLCPEDKQLLLERDEWTAKGVAWCPNQDIHGGNGAFIRRNLAEEGWFDPTRPAEPTEAHKERMARAEAQRLEREEIADQHRIEDQKRRRRMATNAPVEGKPAKAVKTPQNCLCGCGGQTKGGRFIPGHDARFHAREKALLAQGVSADEAAKIASKGPLTGKYAVKPAAAKTEAKAPTNGKPARASKPKPVDLTAKATDEPAATGDIEV